MRNRASKNLRKSSRTLICLAETPLAKTHYWGSKPWSLMAHKWGTTLFGRDQTRSRNPPWRKTGRHSLGRRSLTYAHLNWTRSLLDSNCYLFIDSTLSSSWTQGREDCEWRDCSAARKCCKACKGCETAAKIPWIISGIYRYLQAVHLIQVKPLRLAQGRKISK